MSVTSYASKDTEDVVLLGQAIIDEVAVESLDEGVRHGRESHTSKTTAGSSKMSKAFDFADSLLTAADVVGIREEVHEELRAFAMHSLQPKLMELGAEIKREFRSMLQEVFTIQSKATATSSNRTALGSMVSAESEYTPGLGAHWKEEVRFLIESEFSKHFSKMDKQISSDQKYPRDPKARMVKEIEVKESPKGAKKKPAAAIKSEDRPAPFARRAMRADIVQEAEALFDVSVQPRATKSASSKADLMKSNKKDGDVAPGTDDNRMSEISGEAWRGASTSPIKLSKCPEEMFSENVVADQAAGHAAIVPSDKRNDLVTSSPPTHLSDTKAEKRLRNSLSNGMDFLGAALSTRPRVNGENVSFVMDWEISSQSPHEDVSPLRSYRDRSTSNTQSRLTSAATKSVTSAAFPEMPKNKKAHRQDVFITSAAVKKDTKKPTRPKGDTHDTNISGRRRRAMSIVNSVEFDIASGLLIALNALWIGIQVDVLARRGKSKDIPGYSRAFDTAFAVLFTLELALRLFALQLEFFRSKGVMWNMFDLVLVAFQVTEEVMAWSSFASGNTTSGSSTNFSFMRILRILRFIRVLRLVRIVRLIGELRTMVCSIAGSLKSLGWTCVLMTLQMYVVGVYFTQLVADHGTHDEDLIKSFGSLARSILSLFAAFTGGVDWDTLATPLIETIHPLCGVVFALYIAFAVLAMMNVVTGVFVESALMTARHDKDVDLVNTLREVFVKTDEDSTGTIEWEEFERHIRDPQMEVVFKAVDLDRSEARGLFELIDVEDKGEISREEFIMGCLRLKGPAKALDLATLMYDMKRMSNMLEDHFGMIEHSIEQFTVEQVSLVRGMTSGLSWMQSKSFTSSERLASGDVRFDADEAERDT